MSNYPYICYAREILGKRPAVKLASPLIVIDVSGKLFIAHIQPKFSWACILKLYTLGIWSHYKHDAAGMFISGLSSSRLT